MMKFTLATLAMAATVQATTRNLKSGGGKMKGMKDKVRRSDLVVSFR